MASTAAVHLAMRRRRAAALVEERVDGVSVDWREGEGATVRLAADGTFVAAIEAANASNDPGTRLEYVTDGPSRAQRAAARVRRLLSGAR